MYWGYSPALDLQEEVDCDGEELRALLVGGCDARHILKTLARAYRPEEMARDLVGRHPPRRLTLLVEEASEELLARQMLLLAIALEPPEVLGPREKARLFMEVYGNLHLRPAGARYVRGKAAQLARDAAQERVEEGGGDCCALPLVSLARLRHRERDQMLDVLSFWAAGGRGIFRPASHWDARLRAHLGARYDSRDGVFDWDYHMRLADREVARAVDAREYRHWRRTGLAFTWPGAEPRLPNCTLASGVQRLCGQLCHRGYLGDVVSGPFAAYGMRCEPEDADLLKTKNGARVFTSTDVTERNLMRLFHELQTGLPYERAPDADPGAGRVVMELPEVQLVV
ncbi:dynein axonemal assembly factor 3 [Bacillus rossius redtenbacheri]|uniref:dynein axonemal assembly factor 3 n=1 Tax=Bacillus rossius redtenbacheri TaxID=93214 RepID=UPI002FDE2530